MKYTLLNNTNMISISGIEDIEHKLLNQYTLSIGLSLFITSRNAHLLSRICNCVILPHKLKHDAVALFRTACILLCLRACNSRANNQFQQYIKIKFKTALSGCPRHCRPENRRTTILIPGEV